MTNSSEEPPGHGIDDDQLPDDVRPGEENPLAEGLEAGETAGDNGPGELLEEGKTPDGDGADDGDDEGEDDSEG
jgi:hypothetical protein